MLQNCAGLAVLAFNAFLAIKDMIVMLEKTK